MNPIPKQSSTVINLAAAVIVLAAIKFCDGILAPILVSILLSFIVYPFIQQVKKLGLSHIPASIVTMLIFVLMTGYFMLIIGNSISNMAGDLDAYQVKFESALISLNALLHNQYFDIQGLSNRLSDSISSTEETLFYLASKVGSTMSGVVIILVTTGFMVAEAPMLNKKLNNNVNSKKTIEMYGTFVRSMNQYLVTKSLISLIKGSVVSILLWLLGVEYYILIGVLVFILNFIPNIGPALASIPVIALSFLEVGLFESILVASGYLIVNFIVGNFVEPKLLGNRLGLSPLIVFFSIIFWGWLLGPIGLILSVPLTMAIKISLEASPNNKNLAAMLG